MKKYIITTLVVLLSLTSYAQVGIGIDPNTEAALHIDGDKKSLLLPRMTTGQRPASPARGLMIFNTTINCVEYWNGTEWDDMCTSPPCAGVTAPSGYGIVESSGKCWLDRNLGATQVATQPRSDFSDDSSYIASQSSSFGDLYQWGRAADGHQLRTSANTAVNATVSTDTPPHGDFIRTNTSPNDWRVPQKDDLWQGAGGTNNPCPTGYRLPTLTELNNERLSWVSNDRAGAFASPLRLPVAGARAHTTGDVVGVGTSGVYWSSSVDGTSLAHRLNVNNFGADVNATSRAFGFSVRCLKD